MFLYGCCKIDVMIICAFTLYLHFFQKETLVGEERLSFTSLLIVDFIVIFCSMLRPLQFFFKVYVVFKKSD